MQTGGVRGQDRRFSAGSASLWIASALLCLPGLLLTALRLIPWDIGTPWIQLLSLFPATLLFTAAALAAAVGAVLLDSRPSRAIVAAVAAAVLVAQWAMVLPRILPIGGVTAEAAAVAGSGTGHEVTVMALNVGPSGVDARALIDAARGRKADVLALPELAPAGLEALEAAGVAAEFPYRVLDVDYAGTGNGIFSRFPLDVSERVPGTVFYQSRAEAYLPGIPRGIHLTAVHIDSPRPGHTPFWREELRQLGELRQGLATGTPAILLGDFNAGQDHREFRDLLATGLTDASGAAGKGLAPTWPANSRIPQFVALDHVLVSTDITVLAFDAVQIAGTDHAAIVARLSVQG
ncbi:endonuclease/exonuclease/phosphatase (EEP) superfamily protein YafD [Arthrobacter pascens]|uniref:endonuclease/exonuclease/phosphatase family protein n=1 Tax=Arthrobacter pascens TaxID=1677 RepID=UPI0027840376|nr:endonuclease/exonuclease/phosphatase family protein [Arthrobacter pascens]MDQ0633660.1 endonuclease/exonuclease/phosphatase (EEP) superfamily protein YafD [Arthrobacter pascens]